MQSVIVTPAFTADAKEAGLTEAEMSRIVTAMARDPQGGDAIPGTGAPASVGSRAVAKARAEGIG